MAESPESPEDDGLKPSDRARAIGLIFKLHSPENVRPTVPMRVDILRSRTGRVEAWEVVAWLLTRAEFIIWRRDTNLDGRLKAKGIEPDSQGYFDGMPVTFADQWTHEPIYEEDAPAEPPKADETFLRALDLGLTEPNTAQLEKYGRKSGES